MSDFKQMIRQLTAINEKLGYLHTFLRSTALQFQQRQLEKLLVALDAKCLLICSSLDNRNQVTKAKEEDTLHDAKYAADRIGVSDKTITRLTVQGRLPIDSYVNRKRQFRKSDIERCRRYYRGE